MRQRRGPGRTTRPGRMRAPAARRATVRTGPAVRTTAPRPRAITGRLAVIVVVLVALAMAYAYPIRVYLAQAAQIDKTLQAQEVQRRLIAAQTKRVALWSDERYVLAQARERFHWVRPGETPLIVWDSVKNPSPDAPRPPEPPPPGPWYDTLWSSVRAADAGQRG